jgi:hypothetical protein
MNIPFKSQLRRLKQAYRPVTIFEGRSRTGRRPLSFAYIGANPSYLAYWPQRILGTEHKQTFLGRRFVFMTPRLLRKKYPHCSIILCEENPYTADYFEHKHILRIPQWLRLEIDLSRSLQTRHWNRDNTFKRICTKIRQHAFDYVISRDPADWRNFYDTMHVPYVKSRFGDSSVILPYAEMFDERIPRELLLIRKGGDLIAGIVLNYWPQCPSLGWLGVLNGDFVYVKEGVLRAAYYFSAMAVREKGFERLNIGGSRPIINDGVTLHKIRMAAQVNYAFEYPPHENLLLTLMRDTAGLRDFLVTNQLVGLSPDGKPLCASWIQAEPSKIEFARAVANSQRANFREHRVFCFDETEIPPEWLADDMRGLLKIRSIRDYLPPNDGEC